jgi:uronate dehydrogenase
MQRVLITGAAGGVGKRLRRLLGSVYTLQLTDRTRPDDLGPDEQFVAADLAVAGEIDRAVAGVEGIVHLGAVSVERPWDDILPANIVGSYNLFEAARRHEVQRIVFASSNHVVGFYPRARRIGTGALVRPDGYYGVSKAFGEALGALYAYKFGLRVTCLRIGNVADAPIDERRLSIWVAPGDLVQLVRIGLEHPEIRFEVLWGASDNARGWWDNERAFELGYKPRGRSEAYRDQALAAQSKLAQDPIGDHYQGGTFCSDGYEGPHEPAEW